MGGEAHCLRIKGANFSFVSFIVIMIWRARGRAHAHARAHSVVILAIATKQNKRAAAAFLFIKSNEMLTSSILLLVTFHFFRWILLISLCVCVCDFVSDFTICVYSILFRFNFGGCVQNELTQTSDAHGLHSRCFATLVYYLWSV